MIRHIYIAAFVLLAGCASVPDKAYRPAPSNLEGAAPPIYSIEIDDSGALHDELQLTQFSSAIQGKDKIKIVVFIHGWHHNASMNDENYSEFKKFASQFQEKANSKVIALYIGWRGDSVSSIFDFLLPDVASDFLTIWGRKKTSIVVGEKAVSQILELIKKIIAQNGNQAAIIGHSLGGSVLFNAVKTTLSTDDSLRDKLTYILLNPAIDTSEYDLADTSHFSEKASKPLLVTIQSNKDIAVNWAFRVAYFSSPVGFNDGYITHDMWACNPSHSDCMAMLQKKLSENKCAVAFAKNTWFIDARDDNGRRAPTCDAARKRIDWVIDARHTVSASHNNILTEAEVTALVELIGER